jgi:hypothetical protein
MLPLLLITAASAAEVPLASPWMDATLPVDKRVELILKQMTNAEKQAQTIHLTVRPAASAAWQQLCSSGAQQPGEPAWVLACTQTRLSTCPPADTLVWIPGLIVPPCRRATGPRSRSSSAPRLSARSQGSATARQNRSWSRTPTRRS